MLKSLHIKNYALITQLDIEFGGGFSVLTGETGAGKSIILGALNLVMGGRADTKAITEGEERCVIEAVFGSGDEETIVRRELNKNGRSRSFVNDEVVTQAELKELSGRLLDIHSQNENLLLGDNGFQLGIVDTLASNTALRDDYKSRYMEWQQARKELAELEETAERIRKDRDYTEFQYRQLEEAKLTDADEDERLEAEEYRLSHVEQLQTALQTALQALDGDEGGAIHLVRQAEEAMRDEEELSRRLASVEIELKDIAAETNRIADTTEADPARLQAVQERLDTLNRLMHKHGVKDMQGLISLRDTLADTLRRTESLDEDIAAKRQHTEQCFRSMDKAAKALTESRTKVLDTTAGKLTRSLAELGIAHAHVEIELLPAEEYTESGHDWAELLFAANLNQSLRRVSEVASGGETSRLMLCIKALTASENGLQTLIFDEIDTGISGAVAATMGRIMHDMGRNRQVIAITHLPQTAACGDAQYKVYKQDTATRTETHIRRLTDDERVQEIASMMAGSKVSNASIETARQLLESHLEKGEK